MNFRGNLVSNEQVPLKSGLSESDKDLVMNAIEKTQNKKSGSEDPKIIVVKQEVEKEKTEPQTRGEEKIKFSTVGSHFEVLCRSFQW